MKRFYKEVLPVINNNKFMYYDFRINWIPKDIINDNVSNGYIVQKVKFINTTGIELNNEQIEELEYYEAWKVENWKIIYNDGLDENYDDRFSGGSKYDKTGCIRNSLGKKGKVEYYSKVYWISVNNPLYKIVDSWDVGTISLADKLKSIEVSQCKELEKIKEVYNRPNFIHEVDFEKRDTIKKEILSVFKRRIAKKDIEFNNYLVEMLEDTKYEDLIDELKI